MNHTMTFQELRKKFAFKTSVETEEVSKANTSNIMDGEEILEKLELEKADANITKSSCDNRKASRY
jgi:hypothetical protein